MEKSNKIYSDEQMNVIIGHLKGTRYVEEVQAELVKMGYSLSDGFITRVFGKFSYSEKVWDALNAVALARQQKKRNIAATTNQLVEEEA